MLSGSGSGSGSGSDMAVRAVASVVYRSLNGQCAIQIFTWRSVLRLLFAATNRHKSLPLAPNCSNLRVDQAMLRLGAFSKRLALASGFIFTLFWLLLSPVDLINLRFLPKICKKTKLKKQNQSCKSDTEPGVLYMAL